MFLKFCHHAETQGPDPTINLTSKIRTISTFVLLIKVQTHKYGGAYLVAHCQ
jgi:hypothetical protein